MTYLSGQWITKSWVGPRLFRSNLGLSEGQYLADVTMATITLVAGWLRLYERELAGGGGAAGLMATNWAWSLSYHSVLQRPNNCLAAPAENE